MQKRIAITAIGTTSAIGNEQGSFVESLRNGIIGLDEITLFSAEGYNCDLACEIKNFTAKDYVEGIKTRFLDRATQIAIVCMELAARDLAGDGPCDFSSCALIMGTAFGSLESISSFFKQMVLEGPDGTNPMRFPNTVINSPASQVNIRYHMPFLSATISNGYTAGLDAIQYGCDVIRSGRTDMVVVGGVEELGIDLFNWYHHSNVLATGPASQEGLYAGEGGALLVLEDYDLAQSQGHEIIAEIVGYASCFTIDQKNINGFERSMRKVLDATQLDAKQIGIIGCHASGISPVDKREAEAVEKVFGDIPNAFLLKSLTGETAGGAGALCTAAAALSLRDSFVPVTHKGLHRADAPFKTVNYQTGFVGEYALVNAYDANGSNSSAILRKTCVQ